MIAMSFAIPRFVLKAVLLQELSYHSGIVRKADDWTFGLLSQGLEAVQRCYIGIQSIQSEQRLFLTSSDSGYRT